MGRRTRDRGLPAAGNPASHQSHDIPLDRAEQLRQVDSWRSYRDDTVNLQSSTDSQSRPLGGNRIQSQGLNVHAPAFQPRIHFTPYQPLRVSDGARERLALHQAQHPIHSTTSRYTLRSRRANQIAPYTTGAAEPFQPVTEGDDAGNYRVNNDRGGQAGPLRTFAPDDPLPSVEPRDARGDSNTEGLPRRLTERRTYSQTPENVAPPPPPKTTVKYLRTAAKLPETILSPKKLLVILDLNGTLLVRPNGRVDPTLFKLRPGVTHLLEYLFQNHVVMVYSSARPENVRAIINKLLHPRQRAQMAAIWAREKLDLTKAQYYSKVQVYKRLDKIWADQSIQSFAEPGQKWDQSNTILVDDSHIKALAQPHNLVQVPEFENNAPREGGAALRNWQLEQEEILKSLEQKLEELKWQVDVSRLIREWQTGKRQAPGVVDETVDQKTHQSVRSQQREVSLAPSIGQVESGPSVAQAHQLTYPSPKSPALSTADAGVDDTPTVLDMLEKQINTGLQNTRLSDSGSRRSESPIDEGMFAGFLAGQDAMKDDKGKDNDTVNDVPPTPESMGP